MQRAVFLQVCSAIHNQDFTLVDDYTSSLKALLYLKVRQAHYCVWCAVLSTLQPLPLPSHLPQAVDELSDWDGQSPPTPIHQRGQVVTPKVKEVVGESLPAFGPFLTKRRRVIAELKRSITPVEAFPPEVHRPALRPSKPIPAVKVGTAVCVCVCVCVCGCGCGGCAWTGGCATVHTRAFNCSRM